MHSDLEQKKLALSLGLAAMLMAVLWQWATVHANYGGQWSALFCTGALVPQPPLVNSEHIYAFANSTGYDGQEYHYIAHDPFLRSELRSYLDDARLRYRRILVPLLAYALAFGRDAWVDASYRLVCLWGILLAVYWSCRFIGDAGLSPYWGLLVLTFPAILVTVDRMVADGALAALTVGFIFYTTRPGSARLSWTVWGILACAALTRETGLLLILAYTIGRLFYRGFRYAAMSLLSAAPAFAWYGYELPRTVSQPYHVSFVPFSAILRVLEHPWKYPPSTPLVDAVIAADYLALFGVILAFIFAFFSYSRRPGDPLRIAAALFALMGIVLQRTDHWQNVYDFGRVYSPLLLLLAAQAVQERKGWLLMPVFAMIPRIGIQFAPQVLGVLHWAAVS